MRPLVLHPTSVLAVYAHPDDADVAAGGVLAQWAKEGASVHVVVVADGAKGSSDLVDANLLRTRREGEMTQAARLLGVGVESLHYRDGEFTNDETLRGRLVQLIRERRPDVVLAPDPTAIFFGGVYVNHRDHRETGWAVLDAVAPAAAMANYFPEHGAAHQVSHVLLSGTHEPSVVIDISPTLDLKVTAVLAHQSQISDDHGAVADVVIARAASAGRDVGVSHGEAFRHLELG